MAAHKTAGTLVATGTPCLANGSVVSATADVSTSYSSVVTAMVTNGVSPQILPCQVTVNISNDQVNWRLYRQGTASLIMGAISQFAWDLSDSIMYVQITFSGNDQDVTVESFIHLLDGQNYGIV